MVRSYPQDDEEVIRRRFLGYFYQNQPYPELLVKEAGALGLGLFAGEDIPEETLVGEYTGLVKKRTLFVSARRDYVGEYTIPGYPVRYIIDAEYYGSLLRYVNHADNPNVYSISVIIDDILRIFFVAKRPLQAGEQLFLDYGPHYWKWRKDKVKI